MSSRPLHPIHEEATTERAKIALQKNLIKGVTNSRADAGRAELTEEEFRNLVAVHAAEAVAARPVEKSPGSISSDEISAALKSEMDGYEVRSW